MHKRILHTALMLALVVAAFVVVLKAFDVVNGYYEIKIETDVVFADGYLDLPRYSPRQKTYHFVHHTHTDAGWIYTMSEYEENIGDNILRESIQYLDKVKEESSKFGYVNVEFIRSFVTRHPEHKDLLQRLGQSGVLETINDGIVMPDHACPYFDDLINVFEFGREYAKKFYGRNSRVAWAIDVFGVSKYLPRLMAEMGYEVLAINRISYDMKLKIKNERKSFALWKQLYPEYDLPNYLIPVHYQTPPPYELKNLENTGMIDPSFVVLVGVGRFYRNIAMIGHTFTADNVLVLIGDDWEFRDFPNDIGRFKKVYLALRSNSKSLFHNSTFKVSYVHEALDAIQKDVPLLPELEVTDFFPYKVFYQRDGEIAWSAIFTNEAKLKQQIREFGQFLRAVTQTAALRVVEAGQFFPDHEHAYNLTEDARFWLGITQHHDAITGTCYQHVIDDYEHMINMGIDALNKAYLKKVLPYTEPASHMVANQTFTMLRNSSLIAVINQDISGYKRIKIRVEKSRADRLRVKDLTDGSYVASENFGMLCSPFLPCEVWFYSKMESFETKYFLLQIDSTKRINSLTDQTKPTQRVVSERLGLSYRDNVITVYEDAAPLFEVSLNVYDSDARNITKKFRTQVGMYILKFFEHDPKPMQLQFYETRKNPDGSLALTLADSLNIGFSLTVVVSDNKHVLPTERFRVQVENSYYRQIDDMDIILRYKIFSLDNKGIFYTDSNGIDRLQRIYDHGKPIEQNYYPITKYIHMKDDRMSASVVVDRTSGAVAPYGDTIYVGVLRLIDGKDMFGANRVSMLKHPMSTVHHLIISRQPEDVTYRKQQILDDSPLVYAYIGDSAPTEPLGLNTSSRTVPQVCDQYLRTLLDLREDGLMVRIYNMHDTKNFTIPDVEQFIRERFNLKSSMKIDERSLDYNLPISEVIEQPYRWRNSSQIKKAFAEETQGKTAILKPLKMKTYKISL